MQTIQSSPWITAHPADASTPATSSSSANEATVTANDFLTLLVTELKNQDPTADTDPNAYVNQLVQVNSLQQLIQINQDTTPPTSSPTTSSTSTQPVTQSITSSANSNPAGPLQ